MIEEHAMQLDCLRDQQTPPAIKFEQLPNEAQNYIDELEMEVYDTRQQALVGRTALFSALGAFLIDANFLHLIDLQNSWIAIAAVPLLVLPWFFFIRQWHRNADKFLPTNRDAEWPNPRNERLRAAWELDLIVRRGTSRH